MGVNGIYGLSGSGMDIESMVKVGMMGKQNEYDKMAQKFTKNEWMKSDYIALSNQITTFNASTLSQYKMSTTMNAKSAESSSSAVKVSAGSGAALMTHKVAVTDMASNAYVISTGSIKNASTGKPTMLLKDILFQTWSEKSDGTLTAKTLPPNIENYTGSYGNGYTSKNVSLDDEAITFFISDGVTETDDAKGAKISFTYQELKDGATMNDLASKINSAGLNIRASYDYDNERFSMYNTKSGEGNDIKITAGNNTSGNYAGSTAVGLINALKLTQSKDGELTDKVLKSAGRNTSDSVGGEDGKIWVDGVDYTTKDNKITVGGVTYTALSTNAEIDSDTGKPSSMTNAAIVTVTQDTDAIVDKVKSFVADYNKLLDSLYKKYDEKPNSDYKPLTQSQKDAMKEEQITKWEEKAKAGLLYHDQTIGKIIQKMRSAITDSVEQDDGSTASVFSLGISTTGLKGQLVLDEDKLRKALGNDPDIVYNVLSKPDLEDTAKNGVAQKLGDIFIEATKNIKSRAGSSTDITEDSDLNNLLRQLQTRMSNFKKMMATYENALYKKYDAMEATLAKLGTQLNFVMGGNA